MKKLLLLAVLVFISYQSFSQSFKTLKEGSPFKGVLYDKVLESFNNLMDNKEIVLRGLIRQEGEAILDLLVANMSDYARIVLSQRLTLDFVNAPPKSIFPFR